jgi:hypothetical protein
MSEDRVLVNLIALSQAARRVAQGQPEVNFFAVLAVADLTLARSRLAPNAALRSR